MKSAHLNISLPPDLWDAGLRSIRENHCLGWSQYVRSIIVADLAGEPSHPAEHIGGRAPREGARKRAISLPAPILATARKRARKLGYISFSSYVQALVRADAAGEISHPGRPARAGS